MRIDKSKADFQGWATKNDILCGDGRVIKQDAFAANDGKVVPLVWNHQHNSNSAVLGHALLENRQGGVYAYGFFNETQAGKDAKEQVKHGDVTSLSILANKLVQNGREVMHGCIRELSLVLAGANPGAFIESVMEHGEPLDEFEEEGILYSGEDIIIAHSEDSIKKEKEIKIKYDDEGNPIIEDEENSLEEDDKEKKKKELAHAEKEEDENMDDDMTVEEVLGTLNEDQKAAVGILIEGMKESGGDEMRHSVFENNEGQHEQATVLTHSDLRDLMKMSRSLGSLKAGIEAFNEQNDGILAHALDTTGLETSAGLDSAKLNYGVKGLEMFKPDYKSEPGEPVWISRNMDWVDKVLSACGATPFKRIRTLFADITEDEARAKGYIKGNQKKEEVFALLKRVTDPQTIYKKQKLDRDDILDIEDNFNLVLWMKQEMEVMMKEEKARAILIGDGRAADHEDKIHEINIRPVVTDVPLFNVQIKVPTKNASEAEVAKRTIDAVIRGRKKYKGTGNPVFYTTTDVVTEMLLLEDKIGQKLYKTIEELKTALRVSDIVEVEPMEGMKIKPAGSTSEVPLIGTIVNLADYRIGSHKPADDSGMLEDFDIDYNQYKYLLESRMSGALVKPFSALTIIRDENTTAPDSSSTDDTPSTPSTPSTGSF